MEAMDYILMALKEEPSLTLSPHGPNLLLAQALLQFHTKAIQSWYFFVFSLFTFVFKNTHHYWLDPLLWPVISKYGFLDSFIPIELELAWTYKIEQQLTEFHQGRDCRSMKIGALADSNPTSIILPLNHICYCLFVILFLLIIRITFNLHFIFRLSVMKE